MCSIICACLLWGAPRSCLNWASRMFPRQKFRMVHVHGDILITQNIQSFVSINAKTAWEVSRPEDVFPSHLSANSALNCLCRWCCESNLRQRWQGTWVSILHAAWRQEKLGLRLRTLSGLTSYFTVHFSDVSVYFKHHAVPFQCLPVPKLILKIVAWRQVLILPTGILWIYKMIRTFSSPPGAWCTTTDTSNLKLFCSDWSVSNCTFREFPVKWDDLLLVFFSLLCHFRARWKTRRGMCLLVQNWASKLHRFRSYR